MRTVGLAVLSTLLLLATHVDHSRACTSFVMETPEGPIFGCSLDLFVPGDGLMFINQRGMEKTGWVRSTTGEVLEWTSEYGSVTFSLVGREYAWSGMNDAGLVISSMQLASGRYPERDERPPVNDGSVVQYLLDNCGSVEEAIELIGGTRVQDQSPPCHYLLADEVGGAAAFEYIGGEFLCHVGETLPVRAMANMRYARSAEAYERGGVKWWWPNPGESAERVASAEQRCKDFDAVSDTNAVNYAFETLVHHVAAAHTRWNIVYDIAGRVVHYRSDQSPTYKHVSFADLDFACRDPLLMLDVNAQFEGDAFPHFEPYDPTTNRRFFSTFCSRWNLDVSEEVIDALTEHYETYRCAE